jgi:hypothetical protein
MNALSSEGFEECKREITTSRQDSRPTGGVWQGINPRTGSVASMLGESSDVAGRHRVHGDQWQVTQGRRRPEHRPGSTQGGRG